MCRRGHNKVRRIGLEILYRAGHTHLLKLKLTGTRVTLDDVEDDEFVAVDDDPLDELGADVDDADDCALVAAQAQRSATRARIVRELDWSSRSGDDMAGGT